MRFYQKFTLIVIVVCGPFPLIVMASSPSELGPFKDDDVTNTNKSANEKQEEREGAHKVPDAGQFDDVVNDGADENVQEGQKKNYRDVLRRLRRSVSINMTENTDNTTAADSSVDPEAYNAMLMRKRSASSRLTQHLQSLPGVQGAPVVLTDSGYVQVPLYLSVTVLSILDVNDAQQTLKSGLYMVLEWRDEALMWDTALFDGVETVTLPPDSIWTPPIFIPNSINMKELLKENTAIIVTHEGNVVTYAAVLVETFCNLDLTLYPYDDQTCSIQIMSFLPNLEWDVEGDAYDDPSNALALNSEWELTKVSVRMLEDDVSVFPDVLIRLHRKSTFYSICLVLPMAVTSYMNVLVFLLPLQSGEKISFLVTLFVSTSVYTSFFSNTMPRGLNKVPIAMKLLVGVIVESILVLLTTLLILRRFQAEQEASADFTCSQGTNFGNSDEDNPAKDPVFSIREPPPRALQEQLQPEGTGVMQLSSRSPRVKPLEYAARASRATRAFIFRLPTSAQLDKLMFVIFLIANTIFYITVLYHIV